MSDSHQKVTARHLARSAYLYVRQSTMRQVVENTESTERQYALRQRAIALGWHRDSVVVIDTDLGQSGASATDRAGFQKLVADVGMGRAGIVLGLEVSRLARNSTDWHRLLEICAFTDTLILDEDGIYDPAHFNDRLLLGLKGTILNERGLSTGAGDAFDPVSVQWVRFSAKLPSLKQRLLAAGMLTTKQLCQRLGVERTTIGRWRRRGLIEARICNDLGECLYWPPKEVPPLTSPRTASKGRSTARGAM